VTADVTIETLVDRAQILDCLHRYTRGMDRLDRELARSAYHDDAIDDHGGFLANVEDFLDWAFDYHAKQVRHQHYVSNHFVELDGDTAHAETYYTFVGTDRDETKPVEIVGGRYLDRFDRRDGRWAIAARVCVEEWRVLVPSALSARLAAVVGRDVRRDRDDVSYRRPLTVELPV
jgi:SnoaL-like protein